MPTDKELRAEAATVAAAVAAVQEARLERMQSDIVEIKDILRSQYVTRHEFEPIKMVVFGLVGAILFAVIGAIMVLVLKNGGA